MENQDWSPPGKNAMMHLALISMHVQSRYLGQNAGDPVELTDARL